MYGPKIIVSMERKGIFQENPKKTGCHVSK
jgi:hypothetical protein